MREPNGVRKTALTLPVFPVRATSEKTILNVHKHVELGRPHTRDLEFTVSHPTFVIPKQLEKTIGFNFTVNEMRITQLAC